MAGISGRRKFTGAPFGTQQLRFDISAVHPQNKKPGTYTQAPYCKKANSPENRLLGPGTYIIDNGDFSERRIHLKCSGPNWKRAYECTQLSIIPRMMYRDEWEEKKHLVRQLGPGRYETKDFIETSNLKHCSNRGICETRAPRFPAKIQADIPGPGTYGESGVPWTIMERKAGQSVCMTGLMEGGTGHDSMIAGVSKTKGSSLPPGCYKYVSPIDEFIQKRIGKRGPYDIYTGKRIPESRNNIASTHRGPGLYNIKHFVEELHDEHSKKHGQFGVIAQYPMPPTERIYCSTLSQWPRNKDDPSPGQYEYFKNKSGLLVVYENSKAPFNSTTKRLKKIPSFNPNGPGQYNLERWDNYQHVNGNTCVFKSHASRLPRADSPREDLLNERIHPKHANEECHITVIPVEAPC